MLRLRSFALSALAALVLACGDSSSGPGDDDDDNKPPTAPIMATINGVAWSSSAQTLSNYSASGHTYTLTGAESATGRAIALSLGNIESPGTYALGTSLPLRIASTSAGSSAWITPFDASPAAGTVTVTIATPTRIKGTFSFTAVPSSTAPGTTGTATVTNGSFDVTITP